MSVMSQNNDKNVIVYVSVGSNVDGRRSYVAEALARIGHTFSEAESSEIYESECWQKTGPMYSNAVVRFKTTYTPEKLNVMFKQWEVEAGRTASVSRVALDIDLVIYDGTVLRKRDYERYYFQSGYKMLIHPSKLKITDFTYELPENRIALYPLQERDTCKLLVINKDGSLHDSVFNKIGQYIPKNSTLIYNNTRVINARLQFTKTTGAKIEIFCLEPIEPKDYQLNLSSTEPVKWKCLVGNSKRWHDETLNTSFNIGGKNILLTARRLNNEGTHSIVEFAWNAESVSFTDIIGAAGEIPIPPYLERKSEESDSTDYQTVYSIIEGSVAAPTAGLHFTESLLNELASTGINLREVTLHVGAGTFRPVKSETMDGHDMHSELIDVPKALIKELAENHTNIVAVGTTSIRTLESLYHIGCRIKSGRWSGELDQWYPYQPYHPDFSVEEALSAILDYLDGNGLDRLVTKTSIIIAPGYKFRIVSYLITNFHQPSSTLLLLIAAIVGDRWKEIYHHALDNGYRFLSYGDACLFTIDKDNIKTI